MKPNVQRIIQGFLNLPPARKLTVVGVVILTAVCLGAMVYFSNQIDYGVLFSNLNSDDAAAMTAKLKEKKVPFQLSPDGRTILVPTDKVSELRLEMAASGLPHGGGIGFEIFDNKSSLGATEFEQQISYRRALQGELSRTINGLEEIQSSRVHVALPKDSIFVDQQRKATASVTVKLKSGRALKPQQVDGIVHLVASSIEGLNPADVMVVDSKGNVLSKMPTDPRMPGLSGSQAEYQRNVERDMTGRIQTMLENVVGKGKASVQVTADLDFRVMEKTEEVYDAENPAIRSTQKEVDRSTSKAGDPKAMGAEKEKNEETTNYEINKTVSKTIMPVGDIKKLSIAVLVDGVYTKDAKGAEAYQERPKKELEMLEEIVRKSAGFNAQRGDQVVVTSMPFQRGDAGEMLSAPWTDKLAPFLPIVKYLFVAGVALLAFMFIIKPLLKNVSAAAPAPASQPGGMVNIHVTDGGTEAAGALPGGMGFNLLQAPTQMSESELTRQLADADAKKFAELLRNWLT